MAAKPKIWMLYSTFPNKRVALAAAQTLVKKRLIACANICDNVTSVYRWQGKVQEEKEVTLIAKTQQKKLALATKEMKKLHPYQVPCIVAYPIDKGLPAFLSWVTSETK